MKQSVFLLLAIFMLSGCRTFYEHPDTRQPFIGLYTAVQTSETYNTVEEFPMRISDNGAEDDPDIILYNVNNGGIELRARVAFFEFNIPRQRRGDYIVEGSGRMGVDQVIIDYMMTNVLDDEEPVNVLNVVLTPR